MSYRIVKEPGGDQNLLQEWMKPTTEIKILARESRAIKLARDTKAKLDKEKARQFKRARKTH